MDINVELTFVSPEGSTDEDFEAFLECVIEELENIGRDDVELSASLANRSAIFTVFGTEELPSVDSVLADLRTALHAANCHTAGWEDARLKLAAETEIADGQLLSA
ncbi:hypothetical protein [Cellulomonas cellasea]|uniref:Uncharacterized protein n=1 Tax=Cellulomonas cellasea TaxID=43670 RepID=A0A7W4YAD3_9CELL|nr:hypothetical protein [Cellulomonas cellasea]MBB2921281.1 hypothetical protein [Cellulomonas cellasea]